MMGKQKGRQPKLFYMDINIEERVPQKHVLRKINKVIDFDFIYNEVSERYGVNGHVSVPPPVILKLMLLLVLYNQRSEREMMETLPMRLDWLWFLRLDIDDEVPDHSVLSKARARWGVEIFRGLFERIVEQCVREGLVGGKKLFIDSSLIQANASNNSVVNRKSLKRYLNKNYRKLEQRLEETSENKNGEANKQYISTTDPDAAVTRHGNDKSKSRYKTHRTVDKKAEVITATEITAGSIDDADMLEEMIDRHEQNTDREVETVVGDSKYGTKNNFLFCSERNIKGHMPNLESTSRGKGCQEGIFPKEDFIYNPETDSFSCPAGQRLKKRKFYKSRQHYEYMPTKGVCSVCGLKSRCTRAKDGRTVKRHIRQDELDRMLIMAQSPEAKRDIKTRQHLSERSFAYSTRYGFKRARWRRQWRMQIQDFLIAAIQNIQILLKDTDRKVANARKAAGDGLMQLGAGITAFFELFASYIPDIGLKNKKIRLWAF